MSAFVGYLGPAARAGYWRIYHDLSCRAYTEVADKDILSSEPLDPGNVNGPSLVQVKPGAPAQTVYSISHATGAAFLHGPIAEAHLPQAVEAMRLLPTNSCATFCCGG